MLIAIGLVICIYFCFHGANALCKLSDGSPTRTPGLALSILLTVTGFLLVYGAVQFAVELSRLSHGLEQALNGFGR